MSNIFKLNPKTPMQLTEALNNTLASGIDLKLQIKQAHWNIKGENFIALHELFDKVASAVDEYADMIAERIVQLHGTAHGTLQMVTQHSNLKPYPSEIHKSHEHVTALSAAIQSFANETQQLIEMAQHEKDEVTADILIEVTRGLDKWRWFVESNKCS